VLFSPKEVDVFALDHEGRILGCPLVLAGASDPFLAERGDARGSAVSGGPLLTWSEGDSGRRLAALLTDDGAFQTEPVVVAAAAAGYSFIASAAFTGTGFLYTEEVNYRAMVTKIGLDGAIAAINQPTNPLTEYPQIAWVADHAVLTYADFSDRTGVFGQSYLQKLDPNGAALGSPLLLGSVPEQYNRSPVLAFGDDVVVLLGGFTGITEHTASLRVARLSEDGNQISSPFVVMNDPKFATAWRAVRRGRDMIIGWIGDAQMFGLQDSGTLHLARVAPPLNGGDDGPHSKR
jgi:hypothetical protein